MPPKKPKLLDDELFRMQLTNMIDMDHPLVKAAQPGDYNVFLVSGVYDYYRFIKAGYGSSINEKNIPNLANVLEATLAAFRNESDGKLSAVPFD